MSTPTVPSTIRDDFIATIEALEPAETRHASKRWRYTRSTSDVPGAEIRTFSLRLRPVGDGTLVGCGNDFNFHLEIHTSYHGLQHHDADPLIVEDHRQLWQAIALRAGSLTGLQSVRTDGPWEYVTEDEGNVHGIHRFLVRYLAASDY